MRPLRQSFLCEKRRWFVWSGCCLFWLSMVREKLLLISFVCRAAMNDLDSHMMSHIDEEGGGECGFLHTNERQLEPPPLLCR